MERFRAQYNPLGGEVSAVEPTIPAMPLRLSPPREPQPDRPPFVRVSEADPNAERLLHDDLRGEKYKTKFREDLPVQIRQVCRVADLPQPETIVLRWDDSRRGDEHTWHTLADELGIDPYSRLRDCDFLYVVKWQALPRLWLAGEVSITIDDDLLLKVAGHRRDLEAADNEARTLAVGAGFTEAFTSRNGPDAVAETGAQWVERPENRNSLAWRDTSFMEALLAEWFADVRDG